MFKLPNNDLSPYGAAVGPLAMSVRKSGVWRDASVAHAIGQTLSALLLITGAVLVLLPLLSLVLASVR
jgi:hypothetical protein